MCKRIFKSQTSESGDVPFYKIGSFGQKADAFISNDLFEEYKNKYDYPEIGDLLISASGSIGKIVEYNGEKAYYQDSNIVWLKHDDKIQNSYLKPYYSIIKWNGIEGTTIKRLYNKNILSTKIFFPTNIEQNQIGQFFSKLENTIKIQQRKNKLINKTYIALLNQLIAFNEPLQTLKSVAHLSRESINPSKYPEKNFIEYSMPAFDNYKKANMVKGSSMKSTRLVISRSSILFNKLNVRKRRIWNIKNPKPDSVSSAEFIQLVTDNIDQNYLYYVLQTDDVTYRVQSLSTGSSNSQKRIRPQDMLNLKVPIIDSTKQKKIASILMELHNEYERQKIIVDQLYQIKKFLLQNLFI